MQPGGVVIYDSSVVPQPPDLGNQVTMVGVPCTAIAQELGKVMVKNMVALGALQAATNVFPAESFLSMLRKVLQNNRAMLELNEAAFARGQAAVNETTQPV